MDKADLETLERVLATFGADRDRWPAAERLRLAPLIAESTEARRMMAEARALDRLLDKAPAVSRQRQDALAARIVTEIGGRDAAPVRSGGEVISLGDRSRGGGTASSRVARPPFGRPRPSPVAALLAASLVGGLVLGWSTLGSALLPDLGSSRSPVASAPDGSAASDLQQLVFGDDDGEMSTEEFL